MEIFSQEMMYSMGDLKEPEGGFNKPMLCVATTRKFFDLPTKNNLDKAQIGYNPQYVVSVHDRKKKYGVHIRINPKVAHRKGVGLWHEDKRRVQVERADAEGHIGWSNVGFYCNTEEAMLKMFDESGKKSLYVVIEAL